MEDLARSVMSELRGLVAELGRDGGLMSPSVYDTAQVLRFGPSPGSPRVASWLLEQQRADGGWQEPALPAFRDAPTLAAVLALRPFEGQAGVRESIQAGLEFLRESADRWREPLPRSKPSGIELTFVRLLEEAAAAGLLPASLDGFETLRRRCEKGRRLMPWLVTVARPLACLTWDAWGGDPDPVLVDLTGGVGHAPASTARWLERAPGQEPWDAAREAAQRYLRQAAAATGSGIPGVVPTTWPITRFEQAFGLYALLMCGLFDHAGLRDVIRPHLQELSGVVSSDGIGCTDASTRDGDDTAAALAVLQAGGYPIDLAPLEAFREQDHFCTWPFRLQPSISITARAVHLLARTGGDASGPRDYLLTRQGPDGLWGDDPWNVSMLYTTTHVIDALAAAGTPGPLPAALDAIIGAQLEDGGWGVGGRSSPIETAWAATGLFVGLRQQLVRPGMTAALARARAYLERHYVPGRFSVTPRWIAKDLYCPKRIDRVFELGALFVLSELT